MLNATQWLYFVLPFSQLNGTAASCKLYQTLKSASLHSYGIIFLKDFTFWGFAG
jgi:hypothetical protein